MKPHDAVHRLIEDAMSDQEESKLSVMAKAMSDCIQQSKEDSELDEEAVQLIDRMRLLREAEKENDLMWVDKYHWKMMNYHMQYKLKELVDTVEWEGVYFRYTDFLKCEQAIMSYLDPSLMINLVVDGNNHRILASASDSRSRRSHLKSFKLSTNKMVLLRSYRYSQGKIRLSKFSEEGVNVGSRNRENISNEGNV